MEGITDKGLQIQRIQELGFQTQVIERNFYIFNEYIREDWGKHNNLRVQSLNIIIISDYNRNMCYEILF